MRSGQSDLLPSCDDINSELKRLRAGAGVSLSRLKLSTHLLGLAVIDDEMNHRKFATNDRHLAAFNVITCTVHKVIKSAERCKILGTTLNIDEQDNTLTHRREQLREQFLVSPNTYAEREADAYEHMAGMLVNMTSSPCRSHVPSILGEAEVDTAAVDIVEAIVRHLLVAAGEQKEIIRESLARRLLGLLPNADSMRQQSDEVENFLLRVLQVANQHGRRGDSAMGTVADDGSTIWTTVVWQLIHGDGQRPVELKQAAALEVASVLSQMEQQNQWEQFQILRQPAGGDHPSEQTYITVRVASELLGFDRMTIYRLVHSGELRAFRVGRSFRIAESDLNEYAVAYGLRVQQRERNL